MSLHIGNTPRLDLLAVAIVARLRDAVALGA